MCDAVRFRALTEHYQVKENAVFNRTLATALQFELL